MIRLAAIATPSGSKADSPRAITSALTECSPCCPLVIQTSNGERGRWMIGELSRTQWIHKRVYPFGDDWIAKDWALVIQRLLRRQE
jgi:hypothetical protein